ncbi:threonine--tRNA ligase [Blattabacterium cuenoti]|uniref:threonine--tRNA ligase n=1 Tax=Blattabacterium cuenoti TaxID=1653831 RepID=UPI00163D32BB|nr:threonine--tRNA ligase [Blattabacterium cuenoti]
MKKYYTAIDPLIDHKQLGQKLKLFIFSNNVGQGLPMWLPKGVILRNNLENFLTKIQQKSGYEMIITPHIGSKKLYIQSGHWSKYGPESFQPIKTPDQNEEFIIKPMNCPHHCEVYKSQQWSYRDLPKRFAEFGTVYRYEQSGELQGLTRTRCFTQDDAHIFCTDNQLCEEFQKVLDLILNIFKYLEFYKYTVRISLRDPNKKKYYLGTEQNWNKAEKYILEIVKAKKIHVITNYGEAAFYGPKLDFLVQDSLNRYWQLGTIQIDYNLPERFNLCYIGKNNDKCRPVMIHRAPFGSIERVLSIIIEHTQGNFPLWLSPDQVVIIPISDKYIMYAKKILNLMLNLKIRVFIDRRNEKMDKKIRDSEDQKIPYMIILGNKEEKNKMLSLRRHGIGHLGVFSIDHGINLIFKETDKIIKLL